MAITIEFLSNSSNGLPILITGATNALRTPIHTSIAGVDQKDEIFLYANSSAPNSLDLYLQFGTTGTSGTIYTTVAGQDGPLLVCPGWILNNGFQVSAYAESGNFIRIAGYVQRGP